MDDFDDNLFDEGDAVDYLIYEEIEKELNESAAGEGSGCFGLILILAVPACLLGWLMQL